MKVSVVIPVYNERAFIEEVLLRVQASPIDKEIILVDDKSTDGTRALLEDFDKAQSEGKREVLVQNGKARLSLGNIRFLGQQNLARIAAHARVDPSRDRELALQLLVRRQALLQRGAFRRGKLTIEIIEELVGIHVLREA